MAEISLESSDAALLDSTTATDADADAAAVPVLNNNNDGDDDDDAVESATEVSESVSSDVETREAEPTIQSDGDDVVETQEAKPASAAAADEASDEPQSENNDRPDDVDTDTDEADADWITVKPPPAEEVASQSDKPSDDDEHEEKDQEDQEEQDQAGRPGEAQAAVTVPEPTATVAPAAQAGPAKLVEVARPTISEFKYRQIDLDAAVSTAVLAAVATAQAAGALAQDEIARLSAKVSELTKENARLAFAATHEKNERTAHANTIAVLQEQTNALSRTLTEHRDAGAQMELKLSSLEVDLHHSERMVESLQTRVSELEGELQDARQSEMLMADRAANTSSVPFLSFSSTSMLPAGSTTKAQTTGMASSTSYGSSVYSSTSLLLDSTATSYSDLLASLRPKSSSGASPYDTMMSEVDYRADLRLLEERASMAEERLAHATEQVRLLEARNKELTNRVLAAGSEQQQTIKAETHYTMLRLAEERALAADSRAFAMEKQCAEARREVDALHDARAAERNEFSNELDRARVEIARLLHTITVSQAKEAKAVSAVATATLQVQTASAEAAAAKDAAQRAKQDESEMAAKIARERELLEIAHAQLEQQRHHVEAAKLAAAAPPPRPTPKPKPVLATKPQKAAEDTEAKVVAAVRAATSELNQLTAVTSQQRPTPPATKPTTTKPITKSKPWPPPVATTSDGPDQQVDSIAQPGEARAKTVADAHEPLPSEPAHAQEEKKADLVVPISPAATQEHALAAAPALTVEPTGAVSEPSVPVQAAAPGSNEPETISSPKLVADSTLDVAGATESESSDGPSDPVAADAVAAGTVEAAPVAADPVAAVSVAADSEPQVHESAATKLNEPILNDVEQANVRLPELDIPLPSSSDASATLLDDSVAPPPPEPTAPSSQLASKESATKADDDWSSDDDEPSGTPAAIPTSSPAVPTASATKSPVKPPAPKPKPKPAASKIPAPAPVAAVAPAPVPTAPKTFAGGFLFDTGAVDEDDAILFAPRATSEPAPRARTASVASSTLPTASMGDFGTSDASLETELSEKDRPFVDMMKTRARPPSTRRLPSRPQSTILNPTFD